MNKIALTLAALLVASSTAFAGSDHYGSMNGSQPMAAIDPIHTGSVAKSTVNGDKVQILGADRNLFGH